MIQMCGNLLRFAFHCCSMTFRFFECRVIIAANARVIIIQLEFVKGLIDVDLYGAV